MNYFYDTEFLEDGKTIDLISIGIVAEDGREYYAVSSQFDKRRVKNDSWLMENVMSSISHTIYLSEGDGGIEWPTIHLTDPSTRSRAQIAQDVWQFLLGGEGKPRLWAWYGAYDHVALAQLWGKMINLPDGVPMWTNDIMTLQTLCGGVRAPGQPEGNHNALADARYNKVRYDFYMDLLKS